jgi:hypothetical protein
MPEPRKSGLLVPALMVLIVGTVVADLARRALSGPASPTAAVPGQAKRSRSPRSSVRPEPGLSSAGQAGRSEPVDRDAAARRAWIRQRIEDSSTRTYLPETLSQTDSMLRRWPDERIGRPIRVVVLRQDVRGFREDFVANVTWAVSRWNGVVPVGVITTGDSATADMVVTWVASLDSNRTGRTDLTWDRRGNIHRATVVLATHTPEGQLLDERRMAALALHEIGHTLGLGHSASREDAMYPIAMSGDLSERDRRTARLLYDLPSGSIR